ncbi:hypothetical protein B0H14DRAFT_2423739, partial [Mycena olivaceomarginata]
CLLAYHLQCLDTIRTVYWAGTHITEELQDKMFTTEVNYLCYYCESVVKFHDQLMADDVLGLAMGIEDPPFQGCCSLLQWKQLCHLVRFT